MGPLDNVAHINDISSRSRDLSQRQRSLMGPLNNFSDISDISLRLCDLAQRLRLAFMGPLNNGLDR